MRHENAEKTGKIAGDALCLPELREGKRTKGRGSQRHEFDLAAFGGAKAE
jgi:hypothetical protein|nr:MAG TPA: hypothetical protein [Caudoviricetes sp.]DAN72436.1 MAG TPA: hypothetical protein [Caudoviricetes sp.]